MLALKITSLKHFMNHLLRSDSFDIFLLEEAVIAAANTYTIDGHYNREFFTDRQSSSDHEPSSDPLPDTELIPWAGQKELCLQLIKGKKTPLHFKFVLQLAPSHMRSLLKDRMREEDIEKVKSFVLTIRYNGESAMLTTGTAYHTFMLTREPDIIWDKALTRYLAQKEIACEPL